MQRIETLMSLYRGLAKYPPSGNFKRRSENGVLKWILGGLLYVVLAGMFYCIVKGGNEYDNNQEDSKTD